MDPPMTMTKTRTVGPAAPSVAIHVAERGTRTPKSALRCEIGPNVRFSTASLESYFFAGWQPVGYDALLVAATVEFADRTQRRAAYRWERDIELRVPVHDLARWSDRRVSEALHDVLTLIAGKSSSIRAAGPKSRRSRCS